MIDHERRVLAGITPARRDLLLYALQHLQEEHFRNEVARNIFKLLDRYYNITADILPAKLLADMLSRAGTDTAKSLLYEQFYGECVADVCPESEFRYSVDALKDLRSQQKTGEAITTAFEILERGAEVEGVTLQGHTPAREFLYSELAQIDRLNSVEASPEGDMRKEAEEMRRDYARRKAGEISTGIGSGIDSLDLSTGGFANGELIMVCAYTGAGKSQFVTQTSWDAVVNQGKNVFFATSETVRTQVMRRVIARHSRLPQFGLPGGLNSAHIKMGALDEKGEQVFAAALDDFEHNPTYGKLYIAQVPRGATLGFVEARLARQAANFHVDLCVMDYLALLKADRKRQSSREEFGDILKDAKVMATSHDQGNGVPVISPWSMSQNAYKDALKSGEYQLANLAETSEAEKSADQIISILRQPDTPNEAKVQFLKTRDSELPAPIMLDLDFRSTYLNVKSAGGMALFGGGGGSDDFSGFGV